MNNFKFNLEDTDSIIKQYINFESIKNIALKYNSSRDTIYKLLLRNNIEIRKKNKNSKYLKLYNNKILIERILLLYKENIPVQKIAKEINIKPSVITKILFQEKIIFSSISKNALAKNGLNEKCFDNVENIFVQYFLGFLMADGCVSKSSIKKQEPNVISLGLKKQDQNHIYKFRTFLGSSHNIANISYKIQNKIYYQSHIKIFSTKICQKLKEYGICERKSLIAKTTNNILKNSRYYFLGILDGDGSISFCNKSKNKKEKSPVISLVGSFDILNEFLEYCKKIITTKANINKSKKIYQLRFSHKQAYKLIKHFYKNAEIYLDRKMELAQKIIIDYKDEYDTE